MHVERAEGDRLIEGSFWAMESLKCLGKEASSEQGCDMPGLCLRRVSLGVLGCEQAGERQEARKEPGWQGSRHRRGRGMGRRGGGFMRQYRGRNWVEWKQERWSL